jgi:hypothetical protein
MKPITARYIGALFVLVGFLFLSVCGLLVETEVDAPLYWMLVNATIGGLSIGEGIHMLRTGEERWSRISNRLERIKKQDGGGRDDIETRHAVEDGPASGR